MIRRTAAVALAVALAAPVTATAHEPAYLRFRPGCEYGTFSQDTATGPDRYVGTMRANVLAYSLSPSHNPVTVTTIRCEVRVDGVTVATSGDWPGVGPLGVVPPTPIAFTAALEDRIDLCTLVDVVDGHGQAWDVEICPGPTTLQFPPQPVFDFYDDLWIVFDEAGLPVEETLATAEAVVCETLAGLHLPPGSPVTTGEQGDVYVFGEPWWDCPPYA